MTIIIKELTQFNPSSIYDDTVVFDDEAETKEYVSLVNFTLGRTVKATAFIFPDVPPLCKLEGIEGDASSKAAAVRSALNLLKSNRSGTNRASSIRDHSIEEGKRGNEILAAVKTESTSASPSDSDQEPPSA